ncbi:MAG TPA: hypothetical protein VF472_23230 [Burkholderiaceae bacterium]
MKSPAIAEVHVRVTMNLPGPYPLYYCDQFPTNPQPDCRILCQVPTDIVFSLDEETIEAGWRFAGYAPKASFPMPLHTNLGFSSTFPNHSVTVFNPAKQPGDVHFFSLMYTNNDFNDGAPFSFDPETENQGGGGI